MKDTVMAAGKNVDGYAMNMPYSYERSSGGEGRNHTQRDKTTAHPTDIQGEPAPWKAL